MGDKIKINPNWDNIAKISTEAINLGTTYGKLQGQRYAAYLEKTSKLEREVFGYPTTETEKKEDKPGARKCPYCGKPLIRNFKYCNDECRYRFYLEKQKKEREERNRGKQRKRERNSGVRYCEICGEEITDPNRNKYCCDACAKRAKYLKNIAYRLQDEEE